MNIVLIGGNGKFGQNYQKIFKEFPDVNLIIGDRSNWKSLINEQPSGVIICTPPEAHIEQALYSLEHNIPTMIEKPLALSLEAAMALKPFEHIPILVNHIQLFTQGYQNIKYYCRYKKISSIETYGSSTSPSRSYSSLWDIGPHDISMVLDLIGKIPTNIDCYKYIGDSFGILLRFNDTLAYSCVTSNYCSKQRQIKVECDGIQFKYDDLQRPENHVSPLNNAIYCFLQSISHYNKPELVCLDSRVGLDLSFKILEVLEKCQQTLDIKE